MLFKNEAGDFPFNSLQFQLFVFAKERTFLDLKRLERTAEFSNCDFYFTFQQNVND
ncbi:MAG: hypothetical protein AB8G11_04930 [Saprospiraceae bacterium]